MFRQSLLWLSEQQGISNFVRKNQVARSFASRFVAGETVDEAVAAAVELDGQGLLTTLDLLGESVAEPKAALAAKDQYLGMLDRLQAANLEANVSVKLTQMGLDIDEKMCADNVMSIVERAAQRDGFVRLDMEDSSYTQRTLDFYSKYLEDTYRSNCGVVIQTALRRSADDITHLNDRQIRVRLCKGAYLEPSTVAYPDKGDVDRAYVDLMQRLLLEGNYPGIATHDSIIIQQSQSFIEEQSIPSERYEFQMLYGVRRDIQRELCAAGHRVRVYIPFGRKWYPYLMRRLAERPANIAFILGNIVRESVHR
jgi:proline dehydrogenase